MYGKILAFTCGLSLAAAPVLAKTDAIIVNQTGASFNVSGVAVKNNHATFSGLNGSKNVKGPLVSQGSSSITIDDMHEHGGCGKDWLIKVRGQVKQDDNAKLCVHASGDIPCIVVVVQKPNGLGHFPVQMAQAGGVKCSNQWWSQNKSGIEKAIEDGASIGKIITDMGGD